MSNSREKDLWETLEKYHLWMAFLVTIILVSIYFWIGWMKPVEGSLPDTARTLVLDIIANLIPVLLLLIGSYALFRYLQELKSKRETGELASKVADMVESKLGTLREVAKADQAAAIEERSLIIKSAKYGAKGHYNDVTDRVRSAIAAGKAKVRVDNDLFGPDPIERVGKAIIVDYIYAGREGYSKTVPENAYLIFSTLR